MRQRISITMRSSRNIFRRPPKTRTPRYSSQPLGTRPGQEKRLGAWRPKAIEAAARAERDAQPLTSGDLKRMKRTPPAKITRRALGLTQEEFAAHYNIPLGTLRDWEQGRVEPDQPTQAYLKVIVR